jgi:hypothetical protein
MFISLVVHIIDMIPGSNKDINTFMAKACEKPASLLGLETPQLAAGSVSSG